VADVLSKHVHKPDGKWKLSWWKVVFFVCIGTGLIFITGILVVLFIPETYINNYIKGRIIKEFKSSNPGYLIMITDLNINILKKSIELGTVIIDSHDSAFSCSIDRSSLKGISLWQIIWKGGLTNDALANSVVDAQEIILKFRKQQYEARCRKIIISLHDSVIVSNDLEIHPLVDDNKFFENSEFRRTRFRMILPQLEIRGLAFLKLLEGKLCHSSFIKFRDASFDVLVDIYKPAEQDTTKNLIANDMIHSLKTKINVDSIISSNLYVKYSEINSESSEPAFGYEFKSKNTNLSIKDSDLFADNIDIHPSMDDNHFFAESKFRKTKFQVFLPQLKISGIDYKSLFLGWKYQAHIIQIKEASLDILVSMYKPNKRDTAKTLMPNELFSSIKEVINLDSLSMINSEIKYCESYTAHSKPAVITFNNMNINAIGITNYRNNGDTVVIYANSSFMNTGLMNGILYVPLTSQKFSMHYLGSLSRMDLKKLNSFIEIAEHKRIKSGTVQTANFDIQVKDGHSKGYVRAVYKDFSLALLDSRTGSEKGIMNRIKSFIANAFKLHGTNEKDNSGILKLGKVQWTRKQDDNFTSFAWFSLRSGIANIVGF